MPVPAEDILQRHPNGGNAYSESQESVVCQSWPGTFWQCVTSQGQTRWTKNSSVKFVPLLLHFLPNVHCPMSILTLRLDRTLNNTFSHLVSAKVPFSNTLKLFWLLPPTPDASIFPPLRKCRFVRGRDELSKTQRTVSLQSALSIKYWWVCL